MGTEAWGLVRHCTGGQDRGGNVDAAMQELSVTE